MRHKITPALAGLLAAAFVVGCAPATQATTTPAASTLSPIHTAPRLVHRRHVVLPYSPARDRAYLAAVSKRAGHFAKPIATIGYGREVCDDLAAGQPISLQFSTPRVRRVVVGAAVRYFCPIR